MMHKAGSHVFHRDFASSCRIACVWRSTVSAKMRCPFSLRRPVFGVSSTVALSKMSSVRVGIRGVWTEVRIALVSFKTFSQRMHMVLDWFLASSLRPGSSSNHDGGTFRNTAVCRARVLRVLLAHCEKSPGILSKPPSFARIHPASCEQRRPPNAHCLFLLHVSSR